MAAENVDDLFNTEIQSPSEASFDNPDSALRNAYRFLKDLPKFEPNELPTDERDCEICLEPYGTNSRDRKVVKLPACGHRFGFDCIYEWLSPTNIPNRDTCPKCRVILFELDESGYSDEEMEDGDAEVNIAGPIFRDLDELLWPGGFGPFVAALDFVEPYMRGDHQLPRDLTYSWQIWGIFRRFPPVPTADEENTTQVTAQDIATRLAALMGLLYTRFGESMESMQRPTPWRENGPPVHDMLDPHMWRMILTGIGEFARFESEHDDRPRIIDGW